MTEDIFAEAKRALEILPGPAMMQQAIRALVRKGVGLPRVREWALSTAALYGITDYIERDLDRWLAVAANHQVEA